MGRGLIFSYAQGTYDFLGTATLDGGAHVFIMNNTAGTFNFGPNTAITNPVNGEGFYIAESAPNVTYDGTITQNQPYNLVWIDGLTGGTVAFNGSVTGQTPSSVFGVEILKSTGGTVTFADLHLGTATDPMLNHGDQHPRQHRRHIHLHQRGDLHHGQRTMPFWPLTTRAFRSSSTTAISTPPMVPRSSCTTSTSSR